MILIILNVPPSSRPNWNNGGDWLPTILCVLQDVETTGRLCLQSAGWLNSWMTVKQDTSTTARTNVNKWLIRLVKKVWKCFVKEIHYDWSFHIKTSFVLPAENPWSFSQEMFDFGRKLLIWLQEFCDVVLKWKSADNKTSGRRGDTWWDVCL